MNNKQKVLIDKAQHFLKEAEDHADTYDDIRDRLVEMTFARTSACGMSRRCLLREFRTLNLDFGRHTGSTGWALRFCAKHPSSVVIVPDHDAKERTRRRAKATGCLNLLVLTENEIRLGQTPLTNTFMVRADAGIWHEVEFAHDDNMRAYAVFLEQSATTTQEVRDRVLDLAVNLKAELVVHL